MILIQTIVFGLVVAWMYQAIAITFKDSKRRRVESLARVTHSETFVNDIEAYTMTFREDNEYGG